MIPSFGTVLCATDLSFEGNRALRVAHRLSTPGGTVHRLHVLEPRAAGDPVSEEDEARRRLGACEPTDGPFCTHVLRGSDIADTIEQLARRQHVDIIVMSTRGRTGLARLVLGSVAADVVRKTNLPVILVRDADETGSSDSS